MSFPTHCERTEKYKHSQVVPSHAQCHFQRIASSQIHMNIEPPHKRLDMTQPVKSIVFTPFGGPPCLLHLVVLCVYPVWCSILFTPFGGPLCLAHLVVHWVYPVWWSILFTPFGGPLCLPRLVAHCVYPAWWFGLFTLCGGPPREQ